MNKQYTLNKLGSITSHVEAIRIIVDDHAEDIDAVGATASLDNVLSIIDNEMKNIYEFINVPMIRGSKH